MKEKLSTMKEENGIVLTVTSRREHDRSRDGYTFSSFSFEVGYTHRANYYTSQLLALCNRRKLSNAYEGG